MKCIECGASTMSNLVCFQCRRAKLKKSPKEMIPATVPPIIVKQLENDSDLSLLLKDLSPTIDSSFYLWGAAGVGKSHQAAALLYQIKQNNMDKIFSWINVPSLLLQIRDTFQNKSTQTSELEIVKFYSEVDWLCLDDLGAEKSSDWSLQTLYLIVNERYEQEKTTIITSNLSLSELSDKLQDDRLSSRIAGMCEVIHMDGIDRRTK